jgi:hypothetical protein
MAVSDVVGYRTQPLPPTAEERRAFWRLYTVYLAATAITAGAFILQLALLPNLFLSIFMDFKTSLPLATEVVLEAGGLVREGWWLLLLVPIAVWPIIPARMTVRRRRTEAGIMVGLAYMLMLLILSGLACAVICFSLVLPLTKLLHVVSGV